MERKVIQFAKSLIVTLPVSWTKKLRVQRGDALEVQEQGSVLYLSTKRSKIAEKVRIDLSNKNESYIWHILLGLYRFGYEEMEVVCSNTALIKKISSGMIGFSIIHQEGNICVLKDLTGPCEVKFKDLLRRAFLLLMDLSKELSFSIKEKRESHLKEIDYSINQFTDYCLRILNKRGHEDFRKTLSYHKIISSIELIGDILSRHEKENYSTESKKSLYFAEKIELALREFYNLLFDKHSSTEMIYSLLKETKKDINNIPFSRFHSDIFEVLEQINDLLGELYVINER